MIDAEIVAIDAAMVAQGKSRADLARLLGLDSSQVSRTFSGRRRLQRHEHARVMEWLGITPTPAGPSASITPLPGLIPLYGWGAPLSDAALSLDEAHLRGYRPAHPGQAHLKDAFALEVADIANSPRYEPGEVIYLAAHRWPAIGQFCVYLTTQGEGYLRRYLGRDASGVRFAQLNPPRDELVAAAEVASVHAVVGAG